MVRAWRGRGAANTKLLRQPSTLPTPHHTLNIIMSGIGAELPPHLIAKRKRQQEEQAQDASPIASGAKRSPSPEGAEKRRRVAGPAMPPAPLDERPTEPIQPEENDSSDDDDFGPSLPPTGAELQQDDSSIKTHGYITEAQTEPAKPKRDDWMTMPPEQDGLASRMDPSKLRARGFNTGKGAKAPAEKGGDSSTWHETPEQKRKRLEDEMMGISRPAPGVPKAAGPSKKEGDEVAARALRERTVSLKSPRLLIASDTDKSLQEKARGPSLVDQHQGRKPEHAEDDPSKRAFDREKDMGMGGISRTQKKELLKQAGGFSSKFSGGSFL
jgi:hypothetical protein